MNFIKLLPVLILCLLSSVSYGQQQAQKRIGIWNPPVPVFSQKFDWLKLKSGEWLKGDIISMYDDELEFDSDEFSEITFDWEDVEELRSRFDQRIRFASGEVKQGFLIVKDEHLILISEGKENHYPMSELLSITSSAEDRSKLWDGKISFGIDANSGNVKQLDYLINLAVKRRTPFTRLNVNFIYNYSQSTVEDEKNVITDMNRLTANLDWFYNYHIFLRMLDYEHYSDLQQNIKARDTVGFSAGYHIVQNKRMEWDVTIGPSFQTTSYYNTADDANQKSGVLAVSTEFDYSFSNRMDFIFDYQIQFVEKNSGKRNSYLKTGIEYDIHNDLEVDLIFSLDRIAEPVSIRNTSAPESNDYQLILSVGYNF